MNLTLDVSHFDRSGREIKDSQQENMRPILIRFLVFQIEISGRDANDLH